MPLIQGKSKKAVSDNISTEMAAGKPQKQSIAIALSVQRKNKKKKFANGGIMTSFDTEQRAKADAPATSEEMKMRGQSSYAPAKMLNDFVTDKEETIDMASTPEEMDMKAPYSHQPYKDRYAGGKFAKGGIMTDFGASRPDEDSSTDEEFDMMAPYDHDAYQDQYAGGKFAKGGMMQGKPASIADAIMQKKRMKMYADGGEVDLDLNSMEQPNSYYRQNEDAALKENYDSDFEGVSQPMESNEHGDDIDADAHDMISKIRAKYKQSKKM